MREKETIFGKIILKHDTLYIQANRDIEFDLTDFKSVMKMSNEFAIQTTDRYYCIIDLRGDKMNSTPESREYFANNPYNQYRLGDAVIIDSLANKLIVNFFINFNKPKVPVRMFNDIRSAEKWIDGLKRKHRRSA